MGWIKVCDENFLKNGDLREYDNGEMKILITKIKDKIFATDRICTHAYADLSTGFLNEEEKTVTCPLHMSSFYLESGIPQNEPAKLPLKTYNTKVEDKSVYILIN
jgi:3-phenylpropionate/trans-cinnamate dioxygenase ferredoxin component